MSRQRKGPPRREKERGCEGPQSHPGTTDGSKALPLPSRLEVSCPDFYRSELKVLKVQPDNTHIFFAKLIFGVQVTLSHALVAQY